MDEKYNFSSPVLDKTKHSNILTNFPSVSESQRPNAFNAISPYREIPRPSHISEEYHEMADVRSACHSELCRGEVQDLTTGDRNKETPATLYQASKIPATITSLAVTALTAAPPQLQEMQWYKK